MTAVITISPLAAFVIFRHQLYALPNRRDHIAAHTKPDNGVLLCRRNRRNVRRNLDRNAAAFMAINASVLSFALAISVQRHGETSGTHNHLQVFRACRILPSTRP